METQAVKDMKAMIQKHGITCVVDALCTIVDERKMYDRFSAELKKHGYDE